jgi:hypothetical protein
MQLRDIFLVSGTVGLSPTETSELFFANVGEFWSLRAGKYERTSSVG